MAAQETAIRKRQQIANANRMMFIWVAAISAVVGVAIVGSVFLFQKALFNEKVLAVKSETAKTLRENNEVVPELKDQVRVLNTNQALKDSMTTNQDQPIQTVLDALPADANSSALGSSLQEKFLNDPALLVESLNVDPIIGIESQDLANVEDADDDEASTHEITFRFSTSVDINNASALKNLLQRLERSIRAIDIIALEIETQGNRLLLTVEGRAFYEPAKTVELKEITVKP
ncbi:MAG TPA: hypothetical protein VFM68_04175 [Candidatus Saccharimonadales bacterium]|nr:hypothetical protein [Candidatus Saccharimonadales bacterium]